ncbi:MAG: cysteine desulfurase NifS [Clostridiaceae bacterium]|jgi:cysteine desulfurase|nr:cysteine desulfurase NifS [Clostridiaceae bacterium]
MDEEKKNGQTEITDTQKKRTVYLDHAATTYVDKRVLKEMLPYFTDKFGNANSQHGFGRDTASALALARKRTAAAINAKPEEIYFTSSGSEADNWALRGIAHAHKSKGNHIITTAIEHPAIYKTCQELEHDGFAITYLPVDGDGSVSPDVLAAAITDKTILVSIMFANNEIGTVLPIRELAKVAKAHKILFHTDAVQAVGSIAVNVKDLGVDLLSLSGHKFYGPKGVGALYVRTGIKISRLISGGEQERGLRGGTSNTPSIVGLGKAIELATTDLESQSKKIARLRDYFVKEVEKRIPEVKFNGSRTARLPGNANFSFRYIEGESILFSLDLAGIAASSGSACSSNSLEPSRVLLSIGVPVGIAHGSIRFSFGKANTKADVDYVLEVLENKIQKLRDMSPLYNRTSDEPIPMIGGCKI